MGDKVYKMIEITGSSASGIEEAVQNAIERASRSLEKLQWFEVLETKGLIDGNSVSSWQATLKIAFEVEDK